MTKQEETEIRWELVRALCMQVGAAVDLTSHKMSEARRDPDGWKVEADVEAIQDMQAEIIAKLDYVVEKLIDSNE